MPEGEPYASIGVTTATKELFESARRKVSYKLDRDVLQDEFIRYLLKEAKLD